MLGDPAVLEKKLDVLARAIGGDNLVLRWEAIEEEAGRPTRKRTWPRKRVAEAERGR